MGAFDGLWKLKQSQRMLASPFLMSVDAYVRERGSQGPATLHRAWALPLEPLGSRSEPGGSLKPRVDLALRSLFWLPAAFEHGATVRYPGGVGSGKEDGRTCDPGRRHNRPFLFIATYQYDFLHAATKGLGLSFRSKGGTGI
jgi:hypothetical protein